jgi:hypothetical protein
MLNQVQTKNDVFAVPLGGQPDLILVTQKKDSFFHERARRGEKKREKERD